MVQLTEQAAIELKALKGINGMGRTEGLKLVPDGDRVEAVVGEPLAGDEVIRDGGEALLIVAAPLGDALRELTFDCDDVAVDERYEWRFTLRAA
jgi:hypothetical protein